MTALRPFEGDRSVIVAILLTWVPLLAKDFALMPPDFCNFLTNLGAGRALARLYRPGSTAYASYGIVGCFRGMVDSSLEAYAEFVDAQASSEGMKLEVFLRPRCVGGTFHYIPS